MATLLEIIALAARLAREGSSGTVGTGSTVSQLRDPALRNTGRQPDHLAGAWLLTPDMASSANYQRQCTERPFAPEVGGLSITRPWTVAPDSGDDYYIFNRAPATPDPSNPVSWQGALNDLLGTERIRDRITASLVSGQTRRFTVPAVGSWTPTKASIVAVRGRTTGTDYVEYDGSKNGRWWTVLEDVSGGDAGITIETSWVPGDHSVIVDVIRPRAGLSALTDETDYDLNTAAWGTVWRLYELMGDPPEKVTRAQREWAVRYHHEQPGSRVET